MQRVFEFIKEKIPAVADGYRTETRYDRAGKAYFTWTFVDIEMPGDINTGFKRMYHFAEITPGENGFGVRLSLRWVSLQGGENGVTIFNDFCEII
jgi:hypothetical protein